MTPVAGRPAARLRYACSACGELSPKWAGRCPGCGEWNMLVEELERPTARRAPAVAAAAATPLDALGEADAERRPTTIGELDRVLGGGVVAGALILLGGDPGIGKSTLALELADRAGASDRPALYCAGEESAAQLGLRARRLGCASPAVRVLAETDLDTLVASIAADRPSLAVIDSVQTLYDSSVPGTPGSPTQVREAVSRLLLCAKGTAVPIVLIGHVTKEGAIAGPRTLEHMVDVVLYVEGDRHGDHRLLRGIKNRFGPAGELGLFVMTERGMQELPAAGRAFLDEASLGVAGNSLTITCEGTRPLLVEVQALAVRTAFAVPRRTASGFDLGRLHLLLAVLEKRGRMGFERSDVYVNAVGGVRLAEPAVDLAFAMAVASSARDHPLPSRCVVMGELGLGGEVRRIRRLEARLAEAETLGIESAVIPAGQPVRAPRSLRCHPVATVSEALDLLR